MIDDKTMRLMLEDMESAAKEALRGDGAFYETLRSLKAEINHDPKVLSTVNRLHAAGSRVYSSLIPRIKIRIRTGSGEISLPETDRSSGNPAAPVSQLTRELRRAVSTVMLRGHYREVLDQIMNEAVGSSERFESLAARVERAGHEVVICLDLSAYARVQESSGTVARTRNSPSKQPLAQLLSRRDLQFLKELKISADES